MLAFGEQDGTWPLYFQILWLFSILTFFLVTLLSMRHINKSSESLAEIGIDRNSTLSGVYITLWTTMFLVFPGLFALSKLTDSFYWQFMESPSVDKVYTFGRSAVALYYFFFIATQVLAALDFLVIMTYLRYADQLKPGMAQSVMESLRRRFSNRSL